MTINHQNNNSGSFFNFMRWVKDERAAVLPLAALLFPVILGAAGLSVDVGQWMEQRRDLQTAVDAAALAGAWELGRQNLDLVEFSATEEAVNNGFDPAIGVLNVTYDEDANTVTAELSQEARLYLSSVIFSDTVNTGVSATALVDGYNGDYCILSLNPVSSGSLTNSGAVEIDMPDCGIAVNSSDDEAFKMNGNVNVVVDNVSIVGSYDVAGGSADFIYNDMKTGAPPVIDPYADLVPPEPVGCDFTNYSANGANITLTPGTYCGGINITGTNDVVFEPGVYIIDGGSFDMAGNGSVVAEEVSFVLTSSDGSDYATMDITGGKDFYFSAPNTGDEMAGIVFYQDPDAPTNGSNKLVGNAQVIVDGAMYFPSQEINIGGTSAAAANVCTKIIGNYVTIHGTPFIGNDCTDSEAEPIGDPIIRLIS